jgi:SRSO17 transposase
VVEHLGDPSSVLVVDETGFFGPKPELAQAMLERALAAWVPASWVTADEVSRTASAAGS